METRGRKFCLTVITAAILSFFATQSSAAPDFDFFKGKTVTYVVATKMGGGYDVYARLIGKYMQKYIPGASIGIKNSPGASHILGANEVYLAAPDGLTIGTFNTNLVYSQIAGFSGIKFDLAKYSWIGKASSEPHVLIVSKKSPYKSFKEFVESKEPIKMAASRVGSSTTQLLVAATGANIKMVGGFTGREGEIAMIRGDVTGQVGSYAGFSQFIKSNDCRVLLQFGGRKIKELRDVPGVADIKLPPQGKKLMSILAGTAGISRLTAAPPNVPPARLQVLRDAYKKALNDPDLLKEADRMELDIDPDYGEGVAKDIRDAVNQPPENAALIKKIMTSNKMD